MKRNADQIRRKTGRRKVVLSSQSANSQAFDVRAFTGIGISPGRASRAPLEQQRIYAFPLQKVRRTSNNKPQTTDRETGLNPDGGSLQSGMLKLSCDYEQEMALQVMFYCASVYNWF
ncbi:hypothetical protein AVEN_47938-1 [Araneus ventricosus]|uniref:Uncharacterized protein n=1 Tax=Araneus ventricosus TaxID=182803 RepID=A0A4Y2DSF9_ARAVE|nr:hypothetical protein AVEN_47938-1 [Araneus ventricosus]